MKVKAKEIEVQPAITERRIVIELTGEETKLLEIIMNCVSCGVSSFYALSGVNSYCNSRGISKEMIASFSQDLFLKLPSPWRT